MAVSISGDREDGSAQFGSGGGDEDGEVRTEWKGVVTADGACDGAVIVASAVTAVGRTVVRVEFNVMEMRPPSKSPSMASMLSSRSLVVLPQSLVFLPQSLMSRARP